MPIKHHLNNFRRSMVKSMPAGFLLLWLGLSLMACDSDETLSLSLTQSPFMQQEQTLATPVTSVPTPITIKSQPATLTTVPTIALQIEQSPPTSMETPTALATFPIPTISAPTQVPAASTVSSTTTSDAATEVPTLLATATKEVASYVVYDIGLSSRGFPLTAHQFNDGPRHIVIVGGIHGGYEWNTILLAYGAIDYFLEHPAAVPESVTLTIIPAANPDGQELVTGKPNRFTVEDLVEDTFPGRFNGNDVDLNRNWDCQWAEKALWRDREISGGDRPFSEPETVVLRDFLLQHQSEAVIFLHSAANGVFASGCPGTHQPSMDLAQIYGKAAGYPVYERFSAYEVTGDAGDWLSTQGIASFSVELINHQDLDLEKNLAGILAVLEQNK